ncbi:CLCF1 factor, partial [Sterrhoptilus dennistouni]|nr:CLCF1 factor [Sterrhoptilus dennistouni]
DSWGIFTFLCAALCNLPALPALNCSEELGAGQSIQQTYDLTRYLEHQLRTLAGTYVSPRRTPRDIHPVPSRSHAGGRGNASSPPRAQGRLPGTLPIAHDSVMGAGIRLSLPAGVADSPRGFPSLPRRPPAPSGAPPAPNDFLKKMDDFWLLKELQTWLWRSAKDFNRLKKKVPPAVVTLRLEARGF